MKLLILILALQMSLTSATRTYPNIKPSNVTAIGNAAIADGWTINTSNSTLTNNGVTLSYLITGSAITFTIVSKPFYVDNQAIWGDVWTWVSSVAPLTQ